MAIPITKNNQLIWPLEIGRLYIDTTSTNDVYVYLGEAGDKKHLRPDYYIIDNHLYFLFLLLRNNRMFVWNNKNYFLSWLEPL